MTAQDVIGAASQDVRQVIQPTGAGQTILLDYVDRVQKDCLHSGVYEYLNRSTTTVATVAGTAGYILSPTGIRSVVFVYDRTTERMLLPVPDIVPVNGDPVQTRDALKIITNASLPDFYRFFGTNQINFFPTPLKVVTMEVHYTLQVATLPATTTVLTIPDDGKDMVVAGVNMLASAYLGRMQEAQLWAGVYQQLKGAPTTLVALKPEAA